MKITANIPLQIVAPVAYWGYSKVVATDYISVVGSHTWDSPEAAAADKLAKDLATMFEGRRDNKVTYKVLAVCDFHTPIILYFTWFDNIIRVGLSCRPYETRELPPPDKVYDIDEVIKRYGEPHTLVKQP